MATAQVYAGGAHGQGVDLTLASGKTMFVPWRDVLGFVFTPGLGDPNAKSLAVRGTAWKRLLLTKQNHSALLTAAEEHNMRPQYALSSTASDFLFMAMTVVSVMDSYRPTTNV